MALNKKSVGMLTLVKIAAAILTISYSILQVHIFGLSREIEIYFAAITLLHTLISITQAGHLAEVYLPIYHKIRHANGIAAAHRSFSVVLNWITVAIVILGSLIFFLAPFIVDVLVPGFSTADKQLVIIILQVTVILLLIDVYNSFIRTLLNAEGIFGKAELIDILNTAVSIVVLLFFYDKYGVWTLVASLMIGKIVSFLIYIVYLNHKGISYFFCFRTKEFDHKNFFRTMFNTSLYVVSTQIYVIILTSQLSQLPQGVFAVFKYVQNLYSKLRGVAIQPLMTVFFTNFSKQIQNNSNDLLLEIKPSVSYLIVINTLIIILSFSFGDTTINILWGNDKFLEDSLQLAYWLFIFNCIALFISSISGIYRKIVVSYGLANKLYFFLVFSQLLTALIVYLLINAFQVKGLMLVIPLNVIFLGIVPWTLVWIKNNNLMNSFSWKSFMKIFVLAVLIAPIGRFLNGLIIVGNEMVFSDRLLAASFLLASVAVVIITFVLLGVLLRMSELVWVKNELSKILKINL